MVKFLNDEEKLIFPKHRFKKFIKDIVLELLNEMKY